MTTASTRVLLSVLHAGGAFGLARRVARQRLLVLTYHHVLPRPAVAERGRPANVVFVDEFARQLAYLRRHCHIVDGPQLREHLRGAPLPAHSVLITFDDGYRNNYRYAFPLLREHGASAIFFLTSEFVGDRRHRLWFDRLDAAIAAAPRAVAEWLATQQAFASASPAQFRDSLKRVSSSVRASLVAAAERAAGRTDADGARERVEPMTWAEVRELAAANMVIGCHTASHQILSSATREEVSRELSASRAAIEAQVGECWCFSYPNGQAGDFRPMDVSLVAAAGFECAFTQIPGFVDRETDRFALPRVPVPSTGDFRAFLARATGLMPLLNESTAELRRWVRAS